jgi:hypothetical protein
MARRNIRQFRPACDRLEGRQLLSSGGSIGVVLNPGGSNNVGVSYIVNVASGKVLDDPGGSMDDGTVIQQFQLNGGRNQLWQLIPQGNGTVVIVNAFSGKALDDPGGSLADGAPIEQFGQIPGPWGNGGRSLQWRIDQQWSVVRQRNGFDVIVNAFSGKVLDDPGGSMSNGAPLHQFQFNGGTNQQWEVLHLSGNPVVYNVRNLTSGLVLDDPGFSTASGTTIQQFQFNGGSNQQWDFIPLDDGFDLIVNMASGLALDVPGNSTSNGTHVQQSLITGTTDQQWRVVPQGDGFDAIVNVFSDLALDDPGGSKSNGTPIQQFQQNGGTNQEWDLLPVGGPLAV